jgi:hypothetical protein
MPKVSTFARWFLISCTTYAICTVVVLGIAAVVLKMSLQRMWLPYLLVLGCGLVVSPLLYWVAKSRARPRVCALRFAFVIFVFLQLFAAILGLSGIWLGVVERGAVLDYYFPSLTIGAIISSVVVYIVTRKRLEQSADASS